MRDMPQNYLWLPVVLLFPPTSSWDYPGAKHILPGQGVKEQVRMIFFKHFTVLSLELLFCSKINLSACWY